MKLLKCNHINFIIFLHQLCFLPLHTIFASHSKCVHILHISHFAYFIFCIFHILHISYFAYFIFCIFHILQIKNLFSYLIVVISSQFKYGLNILKTLKAMKQLQLNYSGQKKNRFCFLTVQFAILFTNTCKQWIRFQDNTTFTFRSKFMYNINIYIQH